MHMLCFNSNHKAWCVKDLQVPSSTAADLHVDNVVFHKGMLAFIDLASGILLFDSTPGHREARFVAFPVLEEAHFVNVDCASSIGVHRSVSVGEQGLFLMVTDDLGHEPVLKFWSLCADDDTDEQWKPCYTIPFSVIWDSEEYLAAGLPPCEIPSLGLVDYHDPSLVYLISGSMMFKVDFGTANTVGYSTFFYTDIGVGISRHSSLELCTWKLPSATTTATSSTSKG
jgi:hypothetical protein